MVCRYVGGLTNNCSSETVRDGEGQNDPWLCGCFVGDGLLIEECAGQEDEEVVRHLDRELNQHGCCTTEPER